MNSKRIEKRRDIKNIRKEREYLYCDKFIPIISPEKSVNVVRSNEAPRAYQTGDRNVIMHIVHKCALTGEIEDMK